MAASTINKRPKPLKVSDIDVNNITISDVSSIALKEGKGTMITFNIKYKLGNRLVPFKVQTPRMYAPFGITNNEKVSTGGGKIKWSIQLSFKGVESDPKIGQLYNKIIDIESRIQEIIIKKYASKYIKRWNDDQAEESKKNVIQSIYYSQIKSRDNYSDMLKIDVPWDHEKNVPDNIGFFSEEKKECEYTDVKPRSDVVVIFDFSAVLYVAGNLSNRVNLYQLKYYPSEDNDEEAKKYQFDDSDDEDEYNNTIEDLDENNDDY